MTTPTAIGRATGERRSLASRPGWYRALRPLLQNPLTAISLVVLVSLTIIAFLVPFISPYDPNISDPFNTLKGSSAAHWLGTDENGRDELSRLLYGTRISMSVGLIAVGIAVVVGVPLGLISGYAGGFSDGFIMRMMDSILAFPAIILAMALVAVLGSGLPQIMMAIGVTSVPVYSRLVRAQVLSLKNQEFVTAGVALGASTRRILFMHILPNTLAPIIVQISLGMAFAILSEAGLSYLGLGVQPPTPSWGSMLQKATTRIYVNASLSVYPGVAIFIVVLAFNILGDGLRDVLDPRLRGRLGSRV